MPLRFLPNTITEQDIVEFDLFTVKDSSSVSDDVLVKNLEASENIINYILRQTGWTAFKDYDGNIGYRLNNDSDGAGLTEEQAYNIWIGEFKDKERQFKRIIKLDKMPQTKYDSLLALYWFTGTVSVVGSKTRQFKIWDYIQENKWEWVATILTESGNLRSITQDLASIMMLGDYGKTVSRTLIKERGIKLIRQRYPDAFVDENAKRQAEYIYYVETGRFLPNLTQSRMRQIVKQLSLISR